MSSIVEHKTSRCFPSQPEVELGSTTSTYPTITNFPRSSPSILGELTSKRWLPTCPASMEYTDSTATMMLKEPGSRSALGPSQNEQRPCSVWHPFGRSNSLTQRRPPCSNSRPHSEDIPGPSKDVRHAKFPGEHLFAVPQHCAGQAGPRFHLNISTPAPLTRSRPIKQYMIYHSN